MRPNVMRRRLLGLAVLVGTGLGTAGALAAPAGDLPPDLDAVVAYETRQLLPNGVTRVDTWQERLSRRGERVWVERIVPDDRSAHAHEAAAGSHGHKHFNFGSAARLVERDPKGAMRLRYIDRGRRMVVDVPAAEYGTVGFDGQWEAALHLAPPALIASLPVQVSGGERWRVQKQQGWTHRVSWSDSQRIATRIESQRDDGSYRRVVTVALKPAAPNPPWKGIDGYQRMDYDAFMD